MRKMSSFSGTGHPRILSLERIDYFGTSEYFRENFDGEAINWSGVVTFHCMQDVFWHTDCIFQL